LWNAEETATHKAVRADRGKGKKKCTCGAGCGPRRGCRVPNNAPFSYEQMLEIDLDPASPGISAEDQQAFSRYVPLNPHKQGMPH
ncbi:hypothetical protein OJ913_10145, partial [Streptococcus anginosus]|nr:hypothetical protein [Streptococcus anginosus]